MLQKLLRNRFAKIGLIGVGLVVGGLTVLKIYEYHQQDGPDISRNYDYDIQPQKTDRLADKAIARSYDRSGIEVVAFSEGNVTETEPIPDNYYGDLFYWIAGMTYETVYTSHGERSSIPVLSPEKYDEVSAAFDAYREKHDKSLSDTEAAEIEVEILTEGMSALDAAKYIKVAREGALYLKYAREFAECALSDNPDDFQTLLVWTELQPAGTEEKVKGYKRLLEMNPNFVRALVGLATNLDQTYQDKKVRLLEKAVTLLNHDVHQRSAVRELLKTVKYSQAREPLGAAHNSRN